MGPLPSDHSVFCVVRGCSEMQSQMDRAKDLIEQFVKKAVSDVETRFVSFDVQIQNAILEGDMQKAKTLKDKQELMVMKLILIAKIGQGLETVQNK